MGGGVAEGLLRRNGRWLHGGKNGSRSFSSPLSSPLSTEHQWLLRTFFLPLPPATPTLLGPGTPHLASPGLPPTVSAPALLVRGVVCALALTAIIEPDAVGVLLIKLIGGCPRRELSAPEQESLFHRKTDRLEWVKHARDEGAETLKPERLPLAAVIGIQVTKCIATHRKL